MEILSFRMACVFGFKTFGPRTYSATWSMSVPIEDKARAPVWQMMLESNCKSTSEFLPFMALHPSNGNAILVMHLSMEKFDSHARKPDFFRHLDEMLAPLVESWRKGNDAIGSNGQVVSSIFGGGFA
jgi:hypothetical protein